MTEVPHLALFALLGIRPLRRDCGGVVIARSESDEAIQIGTSAWIASLRSQQ
jgi:hypothetical protein